MAAQRVQDYLEKHRIGGLFEVRSVKNFSIILLFIILNSVCSGSLNLGKYA